MKRETPNPQLQHYAYHTSCSSGGSVCTQWFKFKSTSDYSSIEDHEKFGNDERRVACAVQEAPATGGSGLSD